MFSPIDLLLKNHKLRQKVVHLMQNKFFNELNISIPIENRYWAHLLEKDSYDSFSEIFIKQEYLEFIPDEPISSILDIGAHYGYFSLWLQSKRPEIKLTSLMIEPSPRCARSLNNLVNQEKLDGRFSYLQRAIGLSDLESSPFYDRSHMAGSMYSLSESEKAIQVQNLTEAELVENLEPPYDLIKCDIEGSEWEFLNDFQNLITASKYLLLEWHSWHEGGGGLPQIEKSMHSLDFSMVRSSEPVPAIAREGEVGLILFKNKANI
jgi:FkbM family methyltransferase